MRIRRKEMKDVVADKTKRINIGMPENAIVVGIEEEGNVVRYIVK